MWKRRGGAFIAIYKEKLVNKIPVPCRGCTTRHEACHSGCGRYKEYLAKRESVLAEYDKSVAADKYRAVNYQMNKEAASMKRHRGYQPAMDKLADDMESQMEEMLRERNTKASV